MTIRQRIIEYLQRHPEGVDDDQLAEVLELSARQQANSRCRVLEQEGLVNRRQVNSKIHNFWIGHGSAVSLPGHSAIEQPPELHHPQLRKSENWFWEGNIQEQVIRHLETQGWVILSSANTASRQTGKDVIAQREGVTLWVTVKGYPTGTQRTNATLQAAHWFKDAMFDIIRYRGESTHARLGLALPDFPRYRRLAAKVSWFKPAAQFVFY